MTDRRALVSEHYDAAASGYYQQYQRENLYALNSDYPANYFRLQLLVNRLASAGVRRVYEVGVGEGTPLATMAKMGFDVVGCDISNAMVKVAQDNFAKQGLSGELIQWGDIEDSTTLVAQLKHGAFDAVIAAGVLPHVRNDRLFLENVKMLLKPRGKVLIEFRNKLFSLFTLNRYTKEFVLDDLLAGVAPELKQILAAELDKRLETALPPIREKTASGGVGYDAILSKFHNPFELQELFAQSGFENIRIRWYHYHPIPPMFEKSHPELFRAEAIKLEHEGTWRGYFLCSAGVVEADLR